MKIPQKVDIHVRNTVERCNGVLKMQFRYLFKHPVLHYGPIRAAQIIYSCRVLHKILTLHNIEVQDNYLDFNAGQENNGKND